MNKNSILKDSLRKKENKQLKSLKIVGFLALHFKKKKMRYVRKLEFLFVKQENIAEQHIFIVFWMQNRIIFKCIKIFI